MQHLLSVRGQLGYAGGYNLTTGNYNIDIGNTGVAGDRCRGRASARKGICSSNRFRIGVESDEEGEQMIPSHSRAATAAVLLGASLCASDRRRVVSLRLI